MTRTSLHTLAVSVLACFALLLTGCGIGPIDHSVTAAHSVFQGTVFGGEQPITYSLVSFYETANTGIAITPSSATNTLAAGTYAPAAPLTALGSTYTDFNGAFVFSTPLACSNANDYVYVTSTGGNPGNSAINPNILLMAAVGSCSSFGASTSVKIDELTTVAAAYALSGFISVSGTYTTAVGTSTTVMNPAYHSGSGTTTVQSGSSFASGQVVTLTACGNSAFNGRYVVVFRPTAPALSCRAT